MLNRNFIFLSVCLCLFATFGCGGGDGVKRHDVSGTATFAAAEIRYGEVYFYPDKGPEGYAIIRDGKYDTSLEGGQGVVDGNHRIVVTAYPSEPLVASEDETVASEASSAPIFVNYELTGDLSGGNFDIQVPEDAEGFGIGPAKKTPSNDP